MIKLVYFIRRSPGMDVDAFHAYWREEHARLIASHAAAFNIQRYVQLHATDDSRNAPSDAFPEPFDGVAELWFGSRQGLDEWFGNTTPEAIAAGKAIRADERKFIDRPRSPYVIGEEFTVLPPG